MTARETRSAAPEYDKAFSQSFKGVPLPLVSCQQQSKHLWSGKNGQRHKCKAALIVKVEEAAKMIKRHTKNHGTSIKVGFMICSIFVIGVYNSWPGKNAGSS